MIYLFEVMEYTDLIFHESTVACCQVVLLFTVGIHINFTFFFFYVKLSIFMIHKLIKALLWHIVDVNHKINVMVKNYMYMKYRLVSTGDSQNIIFKY